MQDKISRMVDTLNNLKKDFSSFGSVIGGGTKESPTIAPTSSTSQDVRDNTSGGGIGSWFGMSEDTKEKLSYFDNGQWKIEEVKDNGRSV